MLVSGEIGTVDMKRHDPGVISQPLDDEERKGTR